jgi:hypothetical protein
VLYCCSMCLLEYVSFYKPLLKLTIKVTINVYSVPHQSQENLVPPLLRGSWRCASPLG